MSTLLDQLIKPARHKLGRFLIAENAGPQRKKSTANSSMARSRLDADVLIVGDLAIDVPITIDAPHARILEGAWSIGEPRLGGFVAHAVRSAHKLGARVHVRTALPTPELAAVIPPQAI